MGAQLLAGAAAACPVTQQQLFMPTADSAQVNVYSFGGNARAMATGRSYPEGRGARAIVCSEQLKALSGFSKYAPSLYRIENTCPFRVTNCVDQVEPQCTTSLCRLHV